MNKKLLLSTALASVALTGSALAELSISANTEVTLRSLAFDKTSEDTTGVAGTALGQETNISIKGGKDLDNGMSLAMGGNVEMDKKGSSGSGMREVSMVASNDSMFIGYGRDHGAGVDLDGSVAPHVGDQNDTLSQGSDAFSSAYMDVHASDHLKLGFNLLGGTLAAAYAPNFGSEEADSGVPTGGDSAYSVGYQGNLGIEGLSVQAGYSESDTAANSATTGDKEYSKIGVAYNFGQFAVGGDIQDYGVTTIVDGTVSNGAQAKRVNATFAASDNLAIGVSYTETEESLGAAADGYLTQQTEEITALTVGYNIAGMGFNFSYAETENLGGANGVDTTSWQIQTKQSF